MTSTSNTIDANQIREFLLKHPNDCFTQKEIEQSLNISDSWKLERVLINMASDKLIFLINKKVDGIQYNAYLYRS